jgi:hypothetical protein
VYKEDVSSGRVERSKKDRVVVYMKATMRVTGEVQDAAMKGGDGSVSVGFGVSERAGWDCDFDELA